MSLKRRAFLQQTALALTALGASQVGLSLLASRYQQALAQPTQRKLALLVGINRYPEQVCDRMSAWGSALNGCVTDVELQKELLIHRFGFQPSDILTLTDDQATRQAIEEAFLSHLTEQARSGDVVVFHFSGFGSRVRLTDATVKEQNSLVPVDGLLPTPDHPEIRDLMEETIELLLRSLQTEQVATVLDVSYTDPDQVLQGNLRVRSRPNSPTGQVNPSEAALHDRLTAQTQAIRKKASSEFPGIVLAAAEQNQAAVEGQWQGFSAGLFTYALTQQLWWATPATTLRTTLSRVSSNVGQVIGAQQQPQLRGQKSGDRTTLSYYLEPDAAASADGVIQSIDADAKTVRVWLAGLPAPVLAYYGTSSLLSIEESGSAPLEVAEALDGALETSLLQVRSQNGLLLKTRLCCADTPLSALHVGQPVWERVRVLPRNIGLTVALDSSLERVERVDATSAFATIPGISSVVAGEQPADCLFGKLQLSEPELTASLAVDSTLPEASQETSQETAQPAGTQVTPVKPGYGLFYLGRTAVPNTIAEGDEAVKTAINRLTPKLHTLLSAKLLRLTENAGSSRLGVKASLEMVAPQEQVLARQETARAAGLFDRPSALADSTGEIPTVPIGSHIRYRLQNYSDHPIYFLLMGLDTDGNAIAFYPTPSESSSATGFKQVLTNSVISPASTLLVPQAAVAPEWIVQGSPGLAETYLIFSRSPLTRTFTVLESAIRSTTSNARRISVLSHPLDVTQAILADLHQASLATVPKGELSIDTYNLDVNAWANLAFLYRVTPSETV